MASSGLSRTAKAVLALLALAAACVPCTGAMAAIGLPAWIRYVRRSEVVEARTNLRLLMEAVDRSDGSVELGPTPPLEGLGPPRPFADPAWAALDFAPLEPVRFSYRAHVDRAAGTARLEAIGDLDGDGVRSLFSVDGRLDPSSSSFTWDELIAVEEME